MEPIDQPSSTDIAWHAHLYKLDSQMMHRAMAALLKDRTERQGPPAPAELSTAALAQIAAVQRGDVEAAREAAVKVFVISHRLATDAMRPH